MNQAAPASDRSPAVPKGGAHRDLERLLWAISVRIASAERAGSLPRNHESALREDLMGAGALLKLLAHPDGESPSTASERLRGAILHHERAQYGKQLDSLRARASRLPIVEAAVTRPRARPLPQPPRRARPSPTPHRPRPQRAPQRARRPSYPPPPLPGEQAPPVPARDAPVRPTPAPAAPREVRRGARRAAMLGLGLIFAGLFAASYPRSWTGTQVFTSPRDNVASMLTEQVLRGNGFRRPVPLYRAVPPDVRPALTPRDGAIIDGFIVPQDFAGTILIHAAGRGLLGAAHPILVPLFAAMSAFVVAAIAADFTRWRLERRGKRHARSVARRAGFVAFALWLVFPPSFVNATYIFAGDPIGTFFLLGALLWYFRYAREGAALAGILAALAFGAAVTTRYEYALIGLPCVLALLLTRRLPLKRLAAAVVLLAPFAAAIAIFNWHTYGDFRTTGYHIGVQTIQRTVNWAGSGLWEFDVARALKHLYFYVILWPTTLTLPLIGLASGMLRRMTPQRTRAALLGAAVGGLAFFAYHVGHDLWGSTRPSMNASLLRYTLPLAGLGIALGVSAAVQWAAGRTFRLAVTTFALASAFVWMSVATPGGTAEIQRLHDTLSRTREYVLAHTEPNALIATRMSDKAIVPARQTLILTYLINNQVPVPPPKELPFNVLPSGRRFASVAARIHERGIPMYLLADVNDRVVLRYRDALRDRGLDLRHKIERLFQVAPLGSSDQFEVKPPDRELVEESE